MNAGSRKPADPRFIAGIAIAFASATSLSFITTFARMAYDAGTTPWTLVLLRALFGLASSLAVVLILRSDLRVPRALWGSVLLTGIGLTMISVGYMSSVAFIPVSLAAILFYTFPLIVLGAKMVAARRLPGPRRGGAYALAFIGLTLALGTDIGGMDWRGIALAMMAAVGAAVMYLAGERAMKTIGTPQIALFTHMVAVPVMAIATFSTDSFVTPSATVGWWAILAAGTCYLIGISTQFPALKLAGAAPTALVSNAEPLVSLVVAALVLGERLNGAQYVGGALVIIAVMIGTWLMRNDDR